MNEQAKGWLESARDDLLTIEKILDEEHLTHVVAFHSQQCIEKCFKAVLEVQEERIPKTHDIIVLSTAVLKHISIKIDKIIIAQLNKLYIDSRYPADFGLLPDGKPSIYDAQEFNNYAKDIYGTVTQFIK